MIFDIKKLENSWRPCAFAYNLSNLDDLEILYLLVKVAYEDNNLFGYSFDFIFVSRMSSL